MLTQKFNINTIQKQGETQSLDHTLIEKATRVVVKEMTEIKGTPDEIEAYNRVLARCAAGDRVAQTSIKAMIKKIIEKDHILAQPPLSEVLAKRIYEDNYGLGAIDDLYHDQTINEIWVNGQNHIWIERGGIKMRILDKKFKSDEDVIRIIRLLLQSDKKDITVQEPIRESRMLDGSRITVLIPPVAKRPYINIRKFDAFELSTQGLLNAQTLTPQMVEWLTLAVRGRSNILLIGETSSGKTSLLKWLLGLTDDNLRIGTIESNFEMKIDEKYPERNVFSYEEHPEIGVTLSVLFKKCLRSSPDIIIVGEARGEEADELVRAMRRGHPGSMSTIHTNSPETAINDLAEMINEDGKRRDPMQLHYRIASAIDVIIQIRRFDDTGIRRITRISEVVTNPLTLSYELNNIFEYAVDEDSPSLGNFQKIGVTTEEYRKKLNYFGLPYHKIKEM